MEELKRINSGQPDPILTEEELRVFLKCQHLKGRILYFDESGLDQFIILSPTYISVALDSIVTDVSICKGAKLQNGAITKRSIDDIWQKKENKTFQKHKEYLLGVMTHLSLLVEPLKYDKLNHRVTAKFYYVPSMVKRKDTTGYLRSNNIEQRNIALTFIPSFLTSIIPETVSFRFISYCLSIWAVKIYGQENNNMLFHRSAVFTIDRSLDLCVDCEHEVIVVRLVHSTSKYLIMRDLALSIRECLTAALEKIGQIYVKTNSIKSFTNREYFNMSLCCCSTIDPCLLLMSEFQELDGSWICTKHQLEHTKDILYSLVAQKTSITCGKECPITDNEFLKQSPTDLHVRRLAMQYSITEIKELAIHLGMVYNEWDRMHDELSDPERLKFEILLRCIDRSSFTFHDIKKAVEEVYIRNPHTICSVVRGYPIDFDQEPEKWDLVPTEEHIDRIAPLMGNNSLALLVELGMDFHTWELIRYRQKDRDLVKLNQNILNEWRFTVCKIHNIKPSLRQIGQAFNNIGKNIKIIESVLL